MTTQTKSKKALTQCVCGSTLFRVYFAPEHRSAELDDQGILLISPDQEETTIDDVWCEDCDKEYDLAAFTDWDYQY